MRQNDKLLINLLYKPRAGNDVEKLLKVRFIMNQMKIIPKNILNIYAEYELVMKRNEAF